MSVAIFRSHFGLSREATYGTTGTLGTRYIPVLSFDPGWEDDLERIVDKGIRGAPSMDFAMYTGVSKTRGGYTHYFHPDVAGVFLRGIYGGETVTQSSAGAPHLHTFGTTDVPPSYTLYDYYGFSTGERKIVGAQLERVELSFSRASGAFTVKPTWVGHPSTGIAETTESYSTEAPFRGWEAGFEIAGSTNARILDFNVVLARSVDQIWGGTNTQAPNAREVGPLELSGKFSVYGSTELEFNRYRDNSTGALIFTVSDSTNSLTLNITDFRIEKTTLDRGGNYSRWDCEFRGLHSATDTGPGRIALTVQSSCEF